MTALLSMFVVLIAFQAGSAPAPQGFDHALVIAQVPHRPGHHTVSPGKFIFDHNLRPEGGRIIFVPASGVSKVLTEGFVSAADPSLSFDGRKIIFSAKRSAQEKWNIWEMQIDGTGTRQITRDFGNCREPHYLATSSVTPPEFADKVRWIAFTSDVADTLDVQSGGAATALYALNTEPIEGRGTVVRRCTFNLSSDFSPTVLGDGRVLFTSCRPGEGKRQSHGEFPLLVTNWDGSGLNIFTGDDDGPVLKAMACESPDRTLVFVESEGETVDGSGQLARVSHKRPLHSRQVLSKGGGFYRAPHPLPNGQLLVSFTPGEESRGIHLFDFDRGSPGQKIHADPKWDDLEAIPVVTWPEPQGLISAVVDTEATADLHCLNVYESDRPEAKEIRRGDVRSVRFVEGIPIKRTGEGGESIARFAEAGKDRTRILGEIPVETDGSFFVKLPADAPFFIQTLDQNGMALQTQRGWIWVRRGTSRGCVGCHENKELAPENRATLALRKINPHVLLNPPEKRRGGADFQITLIPILKERCAGCHTGESAAGGLNLSCSTGRETSLAYERLLKQAPRGTPDGAPYVVRGSARRSPLVQILIGGQVRNGTNGLHPAVAITEDEKRSVFEWIDLGARWKD